MLLISNTLIAYTIADACEKQIVIIITIINTGQTVYADEPRWRSKPQKELMVG